jgi:diguanylate cyclase (GGDEF)-like protein
LLLVNYLTFEGFKGISTFSSSHDAAQRVQRDALNMLYRNNSGSLLVNLCVSLALVFGFVDNPEKFSKYIWLAGMSLVFIMRYLDMRHWQLNLQDHKYEPAKPMRRFAIGRYFTAAGLSLYSVWFFHSMDVIELASTVVIMSALAGGASTTLAANKWLAMSYAGILLLPLSVISLLGDEQYQNTLGLLGLVFTFVMYSSAKRACQFTTESILVKNQHADLLIQMAEKNQEVLEANTNLESKVKQRAKKIFELSNIDPLTKLFNRKAFLKNLHGLLHEAEEKQQDLALLFIDLDGFKGVNDVHGHAIGDKVLIAISQRLIGQAHNHASLCRWGGDEFLIALENRTAVEAREFSTSLIKFLSQPIRLEEKLLNLGATIGIAMYPEHSANEIELIELADTAMYAQKQSKKSDVSVFNSTMRDALNREAKLKEGLREALTHEQFYLVYQPVVDSRNLQVNFCEALLRWELDGELISPAEFIPIAEQNGLMYEMGSWVLRQACLEASQWEFDDKVSLSVNVSVLQLVYSDIVAVVKSALEQSGLAAHNLHLEITESIFAEDLKRVIKQVKTLQLLGVKVSVDDFGTGFSSLSLLQRLSADVVKVDRSFVASLNKGGKAIIQATQYIAKELGYSIVVEGVETEQQARVLMAMGVNSLQGFFFAKPMRKTELASWHKQHLKGRMDTLN